MSSAAKDTFYITTPIYYASSPPHVGSAYTTVIADVIARWHRIHDRKTYLLTGVDEHGARQETAAKAAGMSPKEFVDSVAPHYTELWSRLGISNDDFIRTTEERHKIGVGPFMEKLRDAGDIYVAPYEGWYCERCEEFKTDDEIVDGNCPIHGRPVERLREDNYYFRLSKYNDALLELYTNSPGFLQPQRAYNEMYALLKQGLIDQPVSRPTVEWGIPLPWDPKHVIYVWIEALTNYITAIGYVSDPERFARIWPADVHLMAKEIVRHHAVVWPAMLMSVGLPLPKRVFAHGWLMAGGEKISKSGRGITDISPHELIETFGVDGYRFHFVRAVSFGGDGNFSLEDMQARYNAELANDIGNLASRTLAMIDRYFDGVVPQAEISEAPEETLRATIAAADPAADALFADLKVTDAVAQVWEIVRQANRYLVEREPWKLAREEDNRPLVAGVLAVAAEALTALAALLSPVMPVAMRELWSRLGYEGEPRLGAQAPSGNRIRVGEALFPRIEA
ncbi:MAG: methionine--tRNA ligase [Actinomycetota bacterium]